MSQLESRSAFLCRAVQNYMELERNAIDQYVHGYATQPEEAAEIEESRALGHRVLVQEPWE